MVAIGQGPAEFVPAETTPFAGLIGDEYAFLRSACPAVAEVSKGVGSVVRQWQSLATRSAPFRVLEIGCGTGITTVELLAACDEQQITAVDLAAAMLRQAQHNLAHAIEKGQVTLIESDALSYLISQPDGCFDIVASGYVFHNFTQQFRRQVVAEVFRVIRPGGVFVNGDRYALDDLAEQTCVVKGEVQQFFATFTQLGRLDLLQEWIIHLFNDESPDHVMALTPALESYREVGFTDVKVHLRQQNNAVVSAEKPLR